LSGAEMQRLEYS